MVSPLVFSYDIRLLLEAWLIKQEGHRPSLLVQTPSSKTTRSHLEQKGAGFDLWCAVLGVDVSFFLCQVQKSLTLVDADLGILNTVIGQDNEDSVATLLSLDQDHIATEELELLHGGGGEGKDRVIVVGGIVDNQLVGGSLLAKDSSGGVVLRVDAGSCNRGILAVGKEMNT